MSQSTVSLSFKAVSSASLDSLPVSNGQVVALTNADGLYYDMGGVRRSAAEVPSQIKLTSDNSKVVRFGTDANGNYGYYKDGADTVTPFRQPLGNATAGSVVAGKTFANADSDNVTGTLPLVSTATFQFGAVSTTITNNGTYYLPDDVKTVGNGSDFAMYGGDYRFSAPPSTVTVNVPVHQPVIQSSKSTTIVPTEGSSTTTGYVNITPDSGYDAMSTVSARLPQLHNYQLFDLRGQSDNTFVISPSKTGLAAGNQTYGIVPARSVVGHASVYTVKSGYTFSSEDGFGLTGQRSDDVGRLKLDGKTVSRVYAKQNRLLTSGRFCPDSWYNIVPSNYQGSYNPCYRYISGVGLFAHCDWTGSGVGGMSIDMINTGSRKGAIYTLHNSKGTADTSGDINIPGGDILRVERSAKTVYHKINGTNILSWTDLGAAGYIVTEICIPMSPTNLIFMMMFCTSAVKFSKCWGFKLTKVNGAWKASGKVNFGADRTSRANYATAGTQWHTAYVLSPGSHYDLDPYYTVTIHEDAFAYAKNSATPSYYRTCRDLINNLRGLNPSHFALSSTTWRTLLNITGENEGSPGRGVIPYFGGWGYNGSNLGVVLNIRGGFDKNIGAIPFIADSTDNQRLNYGAMWSTNSRANYSKPISLGLFACGAWHLIGTGDEATIIYFTGTGSTAFLSSNDSSSYKVLGTVYDVKQHRSAAADSITNYTLGTCLAGHGESSDNRIYTCNNYSGPTINRTQVVDIKVYHDVMLVCVSSYCIGFYIVTHYGSNSYVLGYAGYCPCTVVSDTTLTGVDPSSSAITDLFHPSRAVSAVHGYDIEFEV